MLVFIFVPPPETFSVKGWEGSTEIGLRSSIVPVIFLKVFVLYVIYTEKMFESLKMNNSVFSLFQPGYFS